MTDRFTHRVGGGGGELRKWEHAGQELEGVWRGMHDGKFGPLGTLAQPDGVEVRFPLHTALLDRMRRVKEGAEVKIRYLGKQTSKGGREFKAFEVWLANGTDEIDPPAEPEPF